MLNTAEGGTAETETIVSQPPARVLIVLALATVYIVWGSTYLAMRVALDTLPPFLLASTRFLIAGVIAYGWSCWHGARRPDRREILDAFITGGLLLLCGNGGVVFALQTVPTGQAAVVVATVPLWVALLEWLRPGGTCPSARTGFCLFLGLAGVAWLIFPKAKAEASVPLVGGLVLVFSSLAWSIGSLYIRARAGQNREPFLKTVALQMLAGGSLLLLAGLIHGELAEVDPDRFSAESIAAMAYLVVAGSLMSYTAYGWLLTVVPPTLVATYAFVNPVVAVLLGCTLGREALSVDALLAGGVVVLAVALMVLGRAKDAPPVARRGEALNAGVCWR